jgi:hypothetical protein
VISLITIKINIDVVHVLMFANCAKKTMHSEETKNIIYCENCNRYYFNHDCFNNHYDVCKDVYKCKACNKVTVRAEAHICGYSRCHSCDETAKTGEHECYMQPKKTKAYTEKYIWFDYEAEQDTGVHKPNLIVVHYFDGTKFYFKTNEEFCEWLISEKKTIKVILPLRTIVKVMTHSLY